MFRAFFFGQEVRRNFCLHEPHLHEPHLHEPRQYHVILAITQYLRLLLLSYSCPHPCLYSHLRLCLSVCTCARVLRSAPALFSALRLAVLTPALYSVFRSSLFSQHLPASIHICPCHPYANIYMPHTLHMLSTSAQMLRAHN